MRRLWLGGTRFLEFKPPGTLVLGNIAAKEARGFSALVSQHRARTRVVIIFAQVEGKTFLEVRLSGDLGSRSFSGTSDEPVFFLIEISHARVDRFVYLGCVGGSSTETRWTVINGLVPPCFHTVPALFERFRERERERERLCTRK